MSRTMLLMQQCLYLRSDLLMLLKADEILPRYNVILFFIRVVQPNHLEMQIVRLCNM